VRLLYETAARANELLALDVEDLDLSNRRARIRSKGGAVEWVFWQTGSAQLLPRLLTGRTRGPVFLAGRRPTRAVAGLDLDPTSRRARLSYRRAAELFQGRTGWSLHQLRHSALTHAAEDGTNLPLLLARSRQASIRSLERYARPGPEAFETALCWRGWYRRSRRGGPHSPVDNQGVGSKPDPLHAIEGAPAGPPPRSLASQAIPPKP
jgi:integrase/recombinase XerD